jgi:nucleoside-diphosphate-sugar epimerase
MASDLDCQLLIFRLASVFGLSPRMRFDVLVNQLVRQAQAENRVVLFHPDHWRPFVHIRDVVDAFQSVIHAGGFERDPMIVNLGSDDNCVTKYALAEELTTLAPGTEIVISDRSLSPPDQNVRLDFSRLGSELGIKPMRTLRQGMGELLSALREGWFTFQPGQYQNRLLTAQ